MTPKELTKKHKKLLLRLAQEPLRATASQVVSKTPKYSGQARINTRIGINQQDKTVVLAEKYVKNAFSNTVENKRVEFARLVKDIKIGDIVFVTSSLDYIKYVEENQGNYMFLLGRKRFKHEVSRVIREAK